MSEIFAEPDETATPLTPEERRDLIPTHIAYRRDLNAAEQENIARAQEWAMDGRRRDLLSEKFIRDLHRRMLGDVWRWAGKGPDQPAQHRHRLLVDRHRNPPVAR